MKLRFFNTFEPVAPLYRDLLPALARLGHNVEVVIATSAYRPGERRRNMSGLQFCEVPAPRVQGKRIGKIVTHGCYAVGAGVRSLLGRPVDLNVFMSQPPLFSRWGRCLEVLRRQPYVCVVMDLYPWFAIEAGLLARDSAGVHRLKEVAANSLRGARAVVVIGRCMAKRMVDLGVASERIHVVPNWANTAVVRPVAPEENRLRKELHLGGERVVMYSGNMGVGHSFEALLAVACRLRNDKGSLFVLAGGGTRRAEVKAAVRREGLNNVRLLDYQPYDRLSESLCLGDVHFVSLRKSFEGLSVPSKAYGALAAGRPIVYEGERCGEIACMLRESGAGLVVDPGDVDGLEAAIRSVLEDAQLRRRMQKQARALATGRYSMERGVARYIDVLLGAPGGRSGTAKGTWP